MSFNLDEKFVNTIETLSRQKNCSKSSLVERLLTISLQKDIDLTPEQRYDFSRCVYVDRCRDILKLQGVLAHEGGICDKFALIVALSGTKTTRSNRKSRNAIYSLSVFELLNDLKAFDIDLFRECKTILFRSRKIYAEYVSLNPEEI